MRLGLVFLLDQLASSQKVVGSQIGHQQVVHFNGTISNAEHLMLFIYLLWVVICRVCTAMGLVSMG